MQFRSVFFAAALVALAVPAAAQDQKPVQVNLGGGFTIPNFESDKAFGTAGNFQFGVNFNLSPVIGIQANYGYNRFGSKDIPPTSYSPGTPLPEPPIVTNIPLTANHTMHSGDFNLVFSAPNKEARVIPYGLAGMGVYYRNINLTTPSVGLATVCDPWLWICYPTPVAVDKIIGERTSTDFGINIGGGFDIPIGESARFFTEIRYIHVYGPTVTIPAIGSTPSTTKKANGNYFPFTFGFRF